MWGSWSAYDVSAFSCEEEAGESAVLTIVVSGLAPRWGA